MNLNQITLPAETLAEYEEFISGQIISIPSDELLEIYERRVLTDLSYLRAEKWDSPEHKADLKILQQTTGTDKVPRNIQNPNYDKLMKFYDQVADCKSPDQAVPIVLELKSFLTGLGVVPSFEYEPAIYTTKFDVRCCENLSMYFNYLLTKLLPKEK